jgi:hypothetical protein
VAVGEWAFEGRGVACGACARPLAVGDAHYSALFLREAAFVRRDFCESCWRADRPAGYFSFWRGVVPEPEELEKRKKRLDASLNTDTLLDVLREMPDDPAPATRRFRFVLSLMLMRRKRLKLLQISRKRTDAGDESFLVMALTGRGKRQIFEIADVKMSEEEMVAAQDEVGRLLVLGGVEEAVRAEAKDAPAEAGEPGPDASRGGDAPEPATRAPSEPHAGESPGEC